MSFARVNSLPNVVTGFWALINITTLIYIQCESNFSRNTGNGVRIPSDCHCVLLIEIAVGESIHMNVALSSASMSVCLPGEGILQLSIAADAWERWRKLAVDHIASVCHICRAPFLLLNWTHAYDTEHFNTNCGGKIEGAPLARWRTVLTSIIAMSEILRDKMQEFVDIRSDKSVIYDESLY